MNTNINPTQPYHNVNAHAFVCQQRHMEPMSICQFSGCNAFIAVR